MARVVLSLLTLNVFAIHAAVARATTTQRDQVLVASTRHYPTVGARTLDFNTFMGYTCGVDGDPCGEPVSLVESGNFVSTWVFVHGNQIPPHEAVKRGVALYRRIRACYEDHGPIRFVIWSWPSERTTNRLRDAHIKRCRTNVESFFLGSYVAAIAADTPVRFVGYSFGARIVGGALHLASGGHLDGHRLRNHVTPITPYRVALLAAAIESDGFVGWGRYRHALQHADHLLLMNNSRDRALRFFWILNSSKPRALGFVGAKCRPPNITLQQYDWARQFGKDHRLWLYLNRPFIIGKLVETLAVPEVEADSDATDSVQTAKQSEPKALASGS